MKNLKCVNSVLRKLKWILKADILFDGTIKLIVFANHELVMYHFSKQISELGTFRNELIFMNGN